MQKHIIFCGVGALGSTAASFCRNFNLAFSFIDFDRVESKNLLAQAFVRQSIGKNKAQALKLQFNNFYSIKSEAYGVKLNHENVDALLQTADLIIDCFDNAASRSLLSAFVQKQKIPLVHAAISADATFGIVRWDERFTADQEDQAGQATCEGGEHLPLIGLVSSTLARSIQDFVNNNEMKDYMISLSGVIQTY